MKKKIKIMIIASIILFVLLIGIILSYIFIISNSSEIIGEDQNIQFNTYRESSLTNENRGIFINNTSLNNFEFYIVHNTYDYSGNSVYETEDVKMYELNGDFTIICHIHFSFTDAPGIHIITNTTTNETSQLSFTPRLYIYTNDKLPADNFRIIVYYQEVGFGWKHSKEKITKDIQL